MIQPTLVRSQEKSYRHSQVISTTQVIHSSQAHSPLDSERDDYPSFLPPSSLYKVLCPHSLFPASNPSLQPRPCNFDNLKSINNRCTTSISCIIRLRRTYEIHILKCTSVVFHPKRTPRPSGYDQALFGIPLSTVADALEERGHLSHFKKLRDSVSDLIP